ncbi:MAG: LytTR family DNA-binding domain-containing protein [Bacteroidota bacterium]
MLNQVYPAPSPSKYSVLIALLFGLFIGGFLWYFEPFDIDIQNGRLDSLRVWGFGLISSVALLIGLYLVPLFFPAWFSDAHWRIKHQLGYWSILLLVIATGNGLYTNYINELPFTWSNYWWIINRTFMLGIIPFSFILLLDAYRRERQFTQTAQTLQAIKPERPAAHSPTRWIIQTDLKQEEFTFEATSFYYARAEGNYIDLYFMEADQLRSVTYRLSLSAFAQQIDHPSLQRCHRSYLVHLDRVQQISGNAQGLKLLLEDGQTVVPVARNYVSAIKAFWSARSD